MNRVSLSLANAPVWLFPPLSSSMADTQPRSRTSPGTLTNPGSSAPCPRTTSCKCGKWWAQRSSSTTPHQHTCKLGVESTNVKSVSVLVHAGAVPHFSDAIITWMVMILWCSSWANITGHKLKQWNRKAQTIHTRHLKPKTADCTWTTGEQPAFILCSASAVNWLHFNLYTLHYPQAPRPPPLLQTDMGRAMFGG